MRPASLALLLFILAGGAVGIVSWRNATEDSRAWKALLSLEGRDLFADAALVARFAAPPGRSPARPWRLFRVKPDSPEEHVLLVFQVDEDDQFFRPWLRVDVLEPPGRRVWSDEFGTGYGTQSVGLRMETARLEVRTEGPDGRQLYAFTGRALRLLRIEDKDGKLQRNEFMCYPAIAGPLPQNLTPSTWEHDLGGPPSDLVLARLAFLGALHPPHAQKGTPGHVERHAAIRAAREHPGVRARLAELRKSPDPWIREAAEAVPLDGTP